MKFSAAAALAFATGALAASNDTVIYVTSVISSTTTYCPEPTTFTYGTKTFTVTKPTTITITDCPVTVKVPVTTKTVVQCHSCGYNATTTPVKPPTVAPTGGVTPTKPPPVQAGAGKVAVGGAAFAGLLGLAALL